MLVLPDLIISKYDKVLIPRMSGLNSQIVISDMCVKPDNGQCRLPHQGIADVELETRINSQDVHMETCNILSRRSSK